MARRRRLPRWSCSPARSCRNLQRARATVSPSRPIDRTQPMSPAHKPPGSEVYEVYAVRYARHDRPARDNFLGGDPHDVNMPLDYFVWAVVGAQRTFIVDMGFTVAQARTRKREYLRSPGEGLNRLGIEPENINDLI